MVVVGRGETLEPATRVLLPGCLLISHMIVTNELGTA